MKFVTHLDLKQESIAFFFFLLFTKQQAKCIFLHLHPIVFLCLSLKIHLMMFSEFPVTMLDVNIEGKTDPYIPTVVFVVA